MQTSLAWFDYHRFEGLELIGSGSASVELITEDPPPYSERPASTDRNGGHTNNGYSAPHGDTNGNHK